MSLLSLFYFERKTGLNKLQHFLGGQRQKLLRKNNCECCLSYTYSKNLMSFFFCFKPVFVVTKNMLYWRPLQQMKLEETDD